MAATPTHLHVASVQTAVPTRVVEPGRSRRIAVAPPPLAAAALQRRFRAVLYYGESPEEDGDRAARARWEEAAWVKESLSAALADHPEMAGRLRRLGEASWEVRLNDTGVRFVQAWVETSMTEFLEAKDREKKDAALAMWTELDAEDPDISALCYVQACGMLGVEKVLSQFSAVAGDGAGGLTVETCTRDGQAACHGRALEVAHWHTAGLEEVELNGRKPVHVSYSISPCVDGQGLVVVMAEAAEFLIGATAPIELEINARGKCSCKRETIVGNLHYILRL